MRYYCIQFHFPNLSGSESGELIIWDLETSKPIRQIVSFVTSGKLEKPHSGSISCLATSKDMALLASGDVHTVINIWNTGNENLLHTLHKHSDEVISLINYIIIQNHILYS